MSASAERKVTDLFERYELAVTDATHRQAGHALPDEAECYDRSVNLVEAQQW